MTPDELLASMARSEPLTVDWFKAQARAMAKRVQEDVHVYQTRQCTYLSQGPDLEHPKRTPWFTVAFTAPAKKAARTIGTDNL